MIAADRPVQRPSEARLLALDAQGRITQGPREPMLLALLHADDLVVANDAATLPASLTGMHLRSGQPIELRLAGRASLAVDDVHRFSAIVFGAGDFRTRTEDRPPPPPLQPDDRLALGPLQARVAALLGHPRLAAVHFDGTADAVWAALARHGRPIQYAHLHEPLALWDVWTAIASEPVAFEPPSAGFVLDWQMIDALRRRGIGFATLTHAAGISSTGDPALDARLPFDEPYRIPPATAAAIARTRERGGRVVAIGTTVVRALEHAAARDGRVPAGPGMATQRITAQSRLRVVDAIVSGTHEPGTSHYELLRAFAGDAHLRRADAALQAGRYRTHEFGDSVWVEACRNCATVMAV